MKKIGDTDMTGYPDVGKGEMDLKKKKFYHMQLKIIKANPTAVDVFNFN